MKYLLIALGILLVVAGVAVYFFYPTFTKSQNPAEITSFEDCQAAGFLVVDTKPRECHTKTGQVFVEEYNGVLLQDVIAVTSPDVDSVITTPFKLEGKAIGDWYLNNQLTAVLEDDNGKVLVTKQVNALSTTQTDDMVPFVAAIDFNAADAGTPKGKILVQKTNTSYTTGETGPLIIPVKFK